VFCKVTLFGALVVPTICEEKCKLVGETVAAGQFPCRRAERTGSHRD
jgi:hypothetical protein